MVNSVSKSIAEKKIASSIRNPFKQGLYDPANEHDSCGVGFIAHMKGIASRQIVIDGLQILENLTHRGAVGADPLVGDGAGMLTQIPHEFFVSSYSGIDFELPEAGNYAVGHMFFPQDRRTRCHLENIMEEACQQEGARLLGWRDVPVDNSSLSKDAEIVAAEPFHRQIFIARDDFSDDGDKFERRMFILRKIISSQIFAETKGRDNGFYIVSFSSRTIIYKGMFLAHQLAKYYKDLSNPAFKSAVALVHQRFSTNTFPSWKLAHPYRFTAHNGEINTVRGNVNWMAARQASVFSPLFGDDIKKLWPISYEGQSDTACLDNALEFLLQGGYSLAHAVMTLIPEAWAGNDLMDKNRQAFYEYHAALMEPWDGPAAVAFCDGRQIGATLDRNGLRPARYFITDDERIIMASEAGVLPVAEKNIVKKWRLQPGRMLLVDLQKGAIISDEKIKSELSDARPYKEFLEHSRIVVEDMAKSAKPINRSIENLLKRQQTFGYSQEDIKLLMEPMAINGQEAIGSMGTDTPLSVLSRKSKLLYSYFKQNFAQVTNPPIDPIREELVMSLVSFIGPRPNLFDLDGLGTSKRLEVRQPILANEDLEKIRRIGDIPDNHFMTCNLDITYPVSRGATGMEDVIDTLCDKAEEAVTSGHNIIILSDRHISEDRVAIPALLAVSSVHHHLIRKGLRTSVGILIESGEPREVHHFAALAGYGAEAINPYLAFETLEELHANGKFSEETEMDEIIKGYVKAIDKGLLKVMSKMGISTYQSYCGAQIFDVVGLSSGFVEKYFTGSPTTIEGAGLKQVARETMDRHAHAFGNLLELKDELDVGGEYRLRVRGEDHAWSPLTIASLQHAVRGNSRREYQKFAQLVNEREQTNLNIRSLFRIKDAEETGQKPLAVEDVESAAAIVKRFSTGAMSYGSISREAHTNLAIAMNRIGAKSNTGEGGEEAERFQPMANGDSARSAIKQVASGRFGVTTEYLANADMIQIKMAQGAKPGEGGQLPGYKVNTMIAQVRHSTPGVGLISPPPHHDIYSIEDLAQLIYDLKNVNPHADISVKLVSETGVGTIAAGVAKAKADHVTISGFDGGTGASPLTSIKHTGAPWEIGLAETHQTLTLNKLRSRIAIQVDGGLRTGRDVVIGALLGADEFGFATAPLIASGCIMMRKCHLNTCPVGVATQDPVLRKRFSGMPEHVINYFFFVAREVRGLMARMGFAKLNDMIGRVEVLDQNRLINHWKAHNLDFSRLFYKPVVPEDVGVFHSERQNHHLEDVLDQKLIRLAKPALQEGTPVTMEFPIDNSVRSAGAMLAGKIAAHYGHKGLAYDTIHVKFTGTAGQSFGAWAARGMTLELEGEANDYVGKGLSGGRLIVYPSTEAEKLVPEENVIVGNTVLYGAISGECYFCGVAGERFGVRNSGAMAVVEGVGDHGCEYMTGGVVVVIGETGRNFAAGMSGGIAYVLDEKGDFSSRCNLALVDLKPVLEESNLPEKMRHADHSAHQDQMDPLSDMMRFDEERLQQMIARHMDYTNSTRAREILENWSQRRAQFVKVMPVDYRRALQDMEQERLCVSLTRQAV